MNNEKEESVTIEEDEIAMLLGREIDTKTDKKDKANADTNKKKRTEFIKKLIPAKQEISKTPILTKEEIAFLLGNNKSKQDDKKEIEER